MFTRPPTTANVDAASGAGKRRARVCPRDQGRHGHRNVLFLGTEFGLWISVDGGQRWAQYKGTDFPSVAVDYIAMQARESDLVLATHGRGIWVVDDISPLRALSPK